MRNFSFFEVEERSTKLVLKALNHKKWGDRKIVVEVAQDAPQRSYPKRKKSKGKSARAYR